MMIQSWLNNGRFEEQRLTDFRSLLNNLDREILYHLPVSVIVKFLSRFGKELTRSLLHEDGVLYLASWLRESNLNQFIRLNLGSSEVLDGFYRDESQPGNLHLRAQPRGLVCHWIAGNIPTLAIFSLVQSMLAKNTNVLRVPQENVPGVIRILKVLAEVEVEHAGYTLRGYDVLKSIALVYFPSSNTELNGKLSMAADARVIWGGSEAVRAIQGLPHREHCESVVFGPKYSFSVADEASLSPAVCRRLAMDVIHFEQSACSSPHVLFCISREASRMNVSRRAAAAIAAAFHEVAPKYPKSVNKYSAILNERGRYLLDPEKDVLFADELDWTILINNDIQLEEPVGSRTLFVKTVPSVNALIPLITNKIQTVGIALQNQSHTLDFCEKLTREGVARCVPIGSMNNYDAPWDGILFIQRLVRWTALRLSEKEELQYA